MRAPSAHSSKRSAVHTSTISTAAAAGRRRAARRAVPSRATPYIARADSASMRVAAGDAPDARDVVAGPPGEEALHVRRGDAHAALGGVPRHLVGAVAEDRPHRSPCRSRAGRAGSRRRPRASARSAARARARGLGRVVRGIDGEVEAGHQVRRRLVDDGLRVVEDEAAVLLRASSMPATGRRRRTRGSRRSARRRSASMRRSCSGRVIVVVGMGRRHHVSLLGAASVARDRV